MSALIPIGTTLTCDKGHLWLYVGWGKYAWTNDNIYHCFCRVQRITLQIPIWEYHATNLDTLCKKFPELRTMLDNG